MGENSIGPHLWLIGITGVGKTSLGKKAAKALSLPFLDLDKEIEKKEGRPIHAIWNEDGEEAFRKLETLAVETAASRAPSVISTGGGVVLAEQNCATMASTGLVVWIRDTVSAVVGRIQKVEDRPILGDGDIAGRLAELLSERSPIYMRAADGIIDRAGKSADQLADEIANFYRNRTNA